MLPVLLLEGESEEKRAKMRNLPGQRNAKKIEAKYVIFIIIIVITYS